MRSKHIMFFLGVGVLIAGALFYGFRPPAILVDTAYVSEDSFRLLVEEEGRTRVADRYEVSAPVDGLLGRVTLEPGDQVARGDALFRISPLQVAPLDARSQAQAEANLARAEAALQATRSQVDSEQARLELAVSEYRRIERMVAGGHMPQERLDQIASERRRATASVRSVNFAVDVARFERDNAQAMLAVAVGEQGAEPVAVNAPVSGRVLTRLRQSEGAVQAGMPILVLGDLASLEVEVDVLSADAVRLRPGMTVELERWGGDSMLPGRVRRIEPAGFTKVSALGVEEQRVWVIVELDAPETRWEGLGDGFRVEARFVLWAADEVLQAPTSALFRRDQQWGSFVVENGRAVYRQVEIGRRSGLKTEVVDGLAVGEVVILYPGQDMQDGGRVRMVDD
ncbi:MAG: HlyD family efflux transporter periplasmic adaptor subunit [Pseudomonadaceae bacterium]|nr:MAG: HlyD family efflux transporter periplasmic adaptor subunit [Pseudomonadaceae bacterium]